MHATCHPLRSLLALASTAVLSLCLWAPSAPALANEALSYGANGNVLTRSQ
jgi:hypothetical protein